MHLDFFPQGHDAALDKVIRVQESLVRQCLCHDKQTEYHQYPTADFVEGCMEQMKHSTVYKIFQKEICAENHAIKAPSVVFHALLLLLISCYILVRQT